ncbi:MAG: glycoside hydrolase family 13 protein [Eubacteriales bacterium]
MHYIPYNSRKGYHKSPFGAVTAGSEVLFRIILPCDFQASNVRLVVQHDTTNEKEYFSLKFECMEGVGEEWWSVKFWPSNPGLLFYHFEYETPLGPTCIYHEGNGLGNISADGENWQLTVYSPAYKSPDWIKGGVMYQIFPDRFFCSGTEKTGVPDDRLLRSDWGSKPMWEPDENGKIKKYDYFGGDLNGIAQKLSRLSELGVTCIYLNPIFEAHSNHRYNTADYLKIDPLLGDEKDFNVLCSLALEKGIRIVLDGVFSHTGADSRYFNKGLRYPPQGAYNSKQSPYYNWYKFINWPNDYKSWWNIDILPEIREDEPGFVEFVTGENGVARKWLRAGASGWRLDVADELPDEFLDDFRKAAKSEKPDAYILGEVWEDASNKSSYGNRRRYLNGAQLDSVMNYPFANALLEYVRYASAESFADKLLSILENYPPQAIHTLMNHIGTHDTVRAITLLASEPGIQSKNGRAMEKLTPAQRKKGLTLMKLISSIQFTLPGVPCIYYGDEAGMEGGQDPFNRGCYPWGNEDEQLLEHYKLLGEIRKTCPALIDGNFEPVSAHDGLIAYARIGRNTRLLTIANSNEKDLLFELPEIWNTSKVLLGDGMPTVGEINVPACSAVILSCQLIDKSLIL